MTDEVAWLAGLSPWPEDGFGLDRMKALLDLLGNPQLAYPGRPRRRHQRQVDCDGDDRAAAARRRAGRRDDLAARPLVGRADSARRRPGRSRGGARASPAGCGGGGRDPIRDDHGRRIDAFADAEVDVAVVEAGLGGRYDATNVLCSQVVLLTGVGLEHTDVLGETVEEIATEKLAVVHTDKMIVVLPDDTFVGLVPNKEVRFGGAARRPRPSSAIRSSQPSRSRSRAGSSSAKARFATARTIPTASAGWARISRPDYTICASILRTRTSTRCCAA